MTKLASLYVITAFFCFAVAADPDEHVKKQEALYFSRIDKADEDLEKAKAEREEKVVDATKRYIKELEKIKVYWTKKGNLEKALELKNRIEKMEGLLKAGNTIPGLPKPKPLDFALASNGATVKSTGRGGTPGSDAMIVDGVSTNIESYSNYYFPCTHTIDLGKRQPVTFLRVHLWNGDPRAYKYKLYISTYGTSWKLIADHSETWAKGVQEFELDGKNIQFIKVEGIGNTANSTFHLKEVEAFDRKPE